VKRLRVFLLRLWSVLRSPQMDRDMNDEIASHLAEATDDFIEKGLSLEDARLAALRGFGGVTQIREIHQDVRSFAWLADLRGDLRYAIRTLARTPAFTIVAAISLALGVGANTIVFSVVNALVFQSLPITQPDRVFFLQTNRGESHSFPNYRDLRDRTVSFDGLIAYRATPINLDSGTAPVRTWGYLASGNYFDVLGVTPALGRLFHQQDDLHEGDAPYAVISYECWTGRFGADPDVIGRTIRLNRTPFTIIGVAPKGFRGVELFFRPDLWVPMMMEPQIEVGHPWLDNRNTWNTWVTGRLKTGVTATAAEADLNVVATQLAHDYPRNEGLHVTLARPGFLGDLLGRPVRAFTVGVFVLAALVLIAACANLASVLAARGADRQRELAIRVSIGASRGRIVRQLLTESLLLALMGGLGACMLALMATRALSAWHAPVDVPVQCDIVMNWRVLLFAWIASATAGLLFGAAPARQASNVDPITALKAADGGARTVSPVRGWPVRDVLVAVQIAVSVVVVAACAVSLQGLQRALTMNLGIDPRGVTTVGFDLGLAGFSPEAGAAFQRRAFDVVSHLTGVASAAYSNSLPLSIDRSRNEIYPDDQPTLKASAAHAATVYEASPGFLRTLGIRLERGRDFEWRDRKGTPRVAMVNRTFARTIMRAEDPIGRHFMYGWRDEPMEIIGIVEDGKYGSLTEPPQPAVFECILQRYNATTTILLKSEVPSEQLVARVRQVMGELDPSLTLYGPGTVEHMLGFALFPSRAAAAALSVFGVLAIVLAGTGIHGLVAYSVARRRREIGIRVALGATVNKIVWMVVSRVAMLLAAGTLTGLALAVAASRVLAVVVYQSSAAEPRLMASVIGVFVVIAVASCWSPVHRSMAIEPTTALRLD
jgi:predicted permease